MASALRVVGVVLLVLVLCYVGSAWSAAVAARAPSLTAVYKQSGLWAKLDRAQQFLKRGGQIITQEPTTGLTVECALCGIAVNEVEGFLIENATAETIEQYLRNDICIWMGGALSQACDDLVGMLPDIINKLESAWSVSAVCVDLGFCQQPFTPYPDPEPVPTYVINLDQPANQRWTKVCSNPTYQATAQFLVNTVDSLLPDGGATLSEIGDLLKTFYYPQEYAQEIEGCAKSLGVTTGWVALFNLGYEVSDACTSIVAQTTDGTILHARNMDFWAGMGFTDSLKNMTFIADYQKGGKTFFKTTGFAGYVGALSGIKPGGFSLTVDTRFYPGGLGQLFYEILAAIEERNASLVTFLTRKVLTNENDFNAALENLSNDELIADVYYIVAGTKAGQGAVISRNRHNATDVWRLNSPSRWFLVETNYDHWTQPPWFDDRVTPANNAMNAIGQKAISLSGLFSVLTVKPVLNIQTTYTILSVPKNGTYHSWTRWCPYPCVE